MRDANTVLFDWDGTLLDSFPAGYQASLEVFRHFGIDVDHQRFLETYSPNWYDSYRALGVPEEEWETANSIWKRAYLAQVTELFPFACATLERLAEAGFVLGLVTSGDRVRVTQELQRFDLDRVFETVVCFEDTSEKKPHPAPLLLALESLDVAAAETIFVGDRPEDIVMGQKAGAYTIGVESQYGPREVLEQAGPDIILPDASHLPHELTPRS